MRAAISRRVPIGSQRMSAKCQEWRLRVHLQVPLPRSAALVAGTDIMTGHLLTDGELIATRNAGTRDRRMERATAVTHLHIYVHFCRGLAVWRGA
ncbi:hypothetical protein AFE_3077 [Acidithiobacillus ferrooxidans ATCC 23270]|uniref:Uncharacterized protein n=1 Tax=Acidithiobacillus ferrooxidans (strain ATCC 23270 / DSM 14882 / CIP 104768 / NCIMB 8455) TaxID=243159 RepID=B7JAI6_ACIF2|nr:hypothetical protein AFE_3077 [Acidithiobacillus ferrooxidans ATCC 23270]